VRRDPGAAAIVVAMSPRRLAAALTSTAAVLLLAVFGAPAARAASATSTNRAGYVAARGHVTFRHVSATWVQPAVTCTAGRPTCRVRLRRRRNERRHVSG
jgi:hypothetical protein